MSELIYVIVSNKDTTENFEEILSETTGIDDSKLVVVPCDNISAIVSQVEKADIVKDQRNALVFAQTVENLSRWSTLLPMRFGSVLGSSDLVWEMLSKNYSELEKNLQMVKDKSEFGVKVFGNAEELKVKLKANSEEFQNSLNDHSGTESESNFKKYVKQKLALYRLDELLNDYIELVIADFNGYLNDLRVHKKVRKKTTGTTIIDGVFLLKNDKQTELIQAVELLESKHPELNFILTGPWPPYSFVDITLK